MDATSAGVPLARVVERKDRLLRLLAGAKPAHYTETVGRLQALANRSVGAPGVFRWDFTTLHTAFTLEGHQRAVTALVAADGALVSASEDGAIIQWDVEGQQPARVIDAGPSAVRCLAVAYEGILFSGHDDGTVRFWDLVGGSLLNALVSEHTGPVTSLAVADVDRQAHERAALPGRELSLTEAAARARARLLGEVDARMAVLFSASADGTVRVWKLDSLDCIAALEGHSGPVHCLLSVGNTLLSGGDDHTVRCWSLGTAGFPCDRTLAKHTGPVHCLVGMKLDVVLSGGADHTIKVWSLSEGSLLTSLEGHSGAVLALCKVDDDLFASVGAENAIRIWSVDELLCLHTITCPAAVLFSANYLLFSGGELNAIKAWTSSTLRLNSHHFERLREAKRLMGPPL
eukprot:EG_transcript_8330